MSKAWAVLALVLLIVFQLSALSLFHDVSANGPTFGHSTVCIAKWNYVQAVVHVQITGVSSSQADVTLPNGTVVTVAPGSSRTITLNLPRTGDYFGSESVSVGPTTLSGSQPIVASVDANVTAAGYNSCMLLSGAPNVDLTTITVSGAANVALSGYGVAL